MRKLYEKNRILFAVLCIVLYCVVMSYLKGNFGYQSIAMLLGITVFANGIIFFVKRNHLEKECGLASWPKNTKRFLYFIPMWILATGNLWDGFALSYHGIELVIAVLSMILVGFVEEMLFRGFLFSAMLSKERAAVAIIVSSLTFGMGHIINLFTGQTSFETIVQMIFAVSWGFILTFVFYKSGSIFPCIIAHSMIDAFSMFGADNALVDQIYVGVTIVAAIVYCIYLGKIKEDVNKNEN
ncbi:CPBP family intramembrane glutamic endopeptidase [Butyrivibrio sp. XPD2006]|uniref:CPBP family intramembrane glutamic endopeptidase n=1 Tax=Butyrivibrio sp. XPD2006 TaxID=1280668 RepID=UPI0003B768E3|nr:CPBP family intramembrane glutamic endopeptidase [Butyrivibrio sp. XPD2006]